MAEKICPQCGAPIESTAAECKFCGEKLTVHQMAQQFQQQGFMQQPQQVTGGNDMGNTEMQRNTGILMPFIIMVICTGVLVVAFFLPFVSASREYEAGLDYNPRETYGETPSISLYECARTYVVLIVSAYEEGYSVIWTIGIICVTVIALIAIFSLLNLLFAILKKPIPVLVFNILNFGVFKVLCRGLGDSGIIQNDDYTWGIAYYVYYVGALILLITSIWAIIVKGKRKSGQNAVSKNKKLVMCRTCNNVIEPNVRNCPVCGAVNRKPFYQKGWFCFLLIIAAVVIGIGAYIGINQNTDRWPNGKMADMLPKIKSNRIQVNANDEYYLRIVVYDVSRNQFTDYIAACREKGFTNNSVRNTDYYCARSARGYELRLSYKAESSELRVVVQPAYETTQTEQSKKRNGFDERTNRLLRMGNYVISIPNYWELSESEEKSVLRFYAETGGKTAFLQIVTVVDNDEVNLEALYADNDNMIEMYERRSDVTEVTSYRKYRSRYGVKGILYEMNGVFTGEDGAEYNTITKEFVFPSEEDNRWFYVTLAVTSNTVWDYNDDFALILNSIRTESEDNSLEPGNSEEQNGVGNNESNIETNNDLIDGMRPEFKEAMDSYEAFYDEYCEFMKKYMRNSSDLTLLSEYMDMLSRLEEMDRKFEAWEDGKMNAAEMKYYLEVQERVIQKMLDVNM